MDYKTEPGKRSFYSKRKGNVRKLGGGWVSDIMEIKNQISKTNEKT